MTILNNNKLKRKRRYNLKWLYPSKKDSKLSLGINKIFIGDLLDLEKPNNNGKDGIRNYFYIKTPTISTNTYFDIVDKIIKKNYSSLPLANNNTYAHEANDKDNTFKYLKFTKSGHITKSCLKKILKFALGICPRCRHSNCITCTKNEHKNYMKNYHLLTKQTLDEYPKYVKCFNCQSMFKTRYEMLNKLLIYTSTFIENISMYYFIFYDCLGWQNEKCQLIYQDLYREFLTFIKNKINEKHRISQSGLGEERGRGEEREHCEPLNNTSSSSSKNNKETLKRIFNSLNASSQKELGYSYESLLYTLNIKRRQRREIREGSEEWVVDATLTTRAENIDKYIEEGGEERMMINKKRKIDRNERLTHYSNNDDNSDGSGIGNDDDSDIIQIPPLAFFIDMNKSMSFFKKIIIEQDQNNMKKRKNVSNSIKNTGKNSSSNICASIKTKYGSVISRCRGGKASLCRKLCCNRRHVLSARVVIVPRYQLEAHQCILPHTLYNRLGCPRYVLCHRYPTLDLRSMTFHEVISTWTYPCMAISTSIVAGNNADFDGDCLHVIPATTLISQAEIIYLMHPKYNMIAQNKLRVMFDHDERQTIYSQFGLNSSDIHQGLFQLALEEGSPKAYKVFCKLRRLCHFIWETRSVSTISFKDFLDIYDLLEKTSLSIPPLPPFLTSSLSPPSPSSSLSSTSHLSPTPPKVSYVDFLNQIYPNISHQNGIKELIDSESSRFSVDHLWQFFGEISSDAPTSFLDGMSKKDFINVAMVSREALIKDVGFYGYNIIKLTHCTKSIVVGYDGCLYTTDGILVARDVTDIIKH